MNPTPTREEFLFIGEAGKYLFYALTYLSIGVAAFQIVRRARIWGKGRPSDAPGGWPAVSRWTQNVWIYILGQKKVQSSRPRSGAPMHMAIFYGFLALFIGTTLLAINTYGPWKFHRGNYYLTYEMTLDIMGAVFIVRDRLGSRSQIPVQPKKDAPNLGPRARGLLGARLIAHRGFNRLLA